MNRTTSIKTASMALYLATASWLACEPSDSTNVDSESSEGPESAELGVTTVTGTWPILELIKPVYTERMVALTDLTALVVRDSGLELPERQATTKLVPNEEGSETYTLDLPIEPQGTFHHFGASSGEGRGVKVFALSARANLFGDTLLSPFELTGWATDSTSIVTQPGTHEPSAGRMLAWAPDGGAFPSGPGADGKLFTADDPQLTLGAGWSVVDLDRQPFEVLRGERVSVPIKNGDMGRDLSGLGYVAAFDALTLELSVRYPFTDVKAIDWSSLIASVRPDVVQAEQAHDADAFGLALYRLAMQTHDGHVGFYPPPIPLWIQRHGAGYGIRIAEADDGSVLVTSVDEGSPAAEAGIALGARLSSWNGESLEAALERVAIAIPESSPHAVRLQRWALLGRAPTGTLASIGYQNPGATSPALAALNAVDDPEGLDRALGGGHDPAEMPVSVSVLPSGIGYVRVTTFSDDLTLTSHAWEWALQHLEDLGVPSLIVDVRGNSGGVDALGAYFAGSFYTQPFVRSQHFAADATGRLLLGGDDVIRPAPVQWSRPVAVLIDADCESTCEEFTAAMAVNPNHLIVGHTPSAGVEAETAPWLLPDGLAFVAPLALFRHVDGSLFVEGSGVAPNLRVPVTAETLLASEDSVLGAAEEALAARH